MKQLKNRLWSFLISWQATSRSNRQRLVRSIRPLVRQVQRLMKWNCENLIPYWNKTPAQRNRKNETIYHVARLLIVVSLLEFVASTVIIGFAWWPWPLFVSVIVFAYHRTHPRKSLWAYGTAGWSSEEELRRAGMIGGRKGLAVGRLATQSDMPLATRLLSIVDRDISAKEACERFMPSARSMKFGTNDEVVRLKNSVHTAVFGPTGSGKGASFIIPWLLEMDESAVVLDFKGENAAITALHRQRVFGHHCVLLDPFHVVTQDSYCLNPLDFIERNSPTLIDDCRDLAEQLVLRTGDEREPHWNDSAEMWITGAVVATTKDAEMNDRSLQAVRDMLSNPKKIPLLIELLCNSEGMIPRLGGQLAHFRDKELSSVLTTVNRHLRFLDTPAVAAITASSTFDPTKLREGKMTVYCIIPPEHMRAQAGLIRVWIGTLMRSIIQGGLQRG